MPNNTQMTDFEIIELLGGVTAVARMLDIKPPSVHGWLDSGIPDGRLRDLAGQIELRSQGRFSRKDRWPDKYLFYWPELADKTQPEQPPALTPPAQAAITVIALGSAQAQTPTPSEQPSHQAPPGAAGAGQQGSGWAGVERRHATEKTCDIPGLERRAPMAAKLAEQGF